VVERLVASRFLGGMNVGDEYASPLARRHMARLEGAGPSRAQASISRLSGRLVLCQQGKTFPSPTGIRTEIGQAATDCAIVPQIGPDSVRSYNPRTPISSCSRAPVGGIWSRHTPLLHPSPTRWRRLLTIPLRVAASDSAHPCSHRRSDGEQSSSTAARFLLLGPDERGL